MDSSAVIAIQSFFRGGEAFWDPLFLGVTMFGEEVWLVGLAFCIYWTSCRRSSETLLLALFASQILNGVLKNAFQVPRPFVSDEGVRYLELRSLLVNTAKLRESFSFPSGHAQLGVTFYLGLTRLFSGRWNRLIYLLLPLLLLSRPYLGVHYPGDVLIGAALGIVVLSAVLRFRAVRRESGLVLGVFLLFGAAIGCCFFPGTDLLRGSVLGSGALLGLMLEERHLRFAPALSKSNTVFRSAGGMFLLLLIYRLCRMMASVRWLYMGGHFLIGFTAAFLWPCLFHYCEARLASQRAERSDRYR